MPTGSNVAENILTTVAFWYLAFASVAAAVAMISLRNPVHSAISLVIVIFHVAGLFVILGSGFLAVAQIAIYAGAIVVLFLFTLMMLDMRHLPNSRVTHRQMWLGIPVAILLAIETILIALSTPAIDESIKGFYPPSTVSELGGSTEALAKMLFTSYTLPFLMASIMLTAATIGAIVLARRIETSEATTDNESTSTTESTSTLERSAQ